MTKRRQILIWLALAGACVAVFFAVDALRRLSQGTQIIMLLFVVLGLPITNLTMKT